MCATCDSVLAFDAAFEPRHLLSFEVAPAWRLSSQVAAGGDTTCVLRTDHGEPVGEFEDEPAPVHTLIRGPPKRVLGGRVLGERACYRPPP